MSAIYRPSDWQIEFHSAQVNELLGAGSAGPGKTTGLRFDFLPQLRVETDRAKLPADDPNAIPPGGSNGWWLYLRRTNNMLEQEIKKTERAFRALCPSVTWKSDSSGGRTYTFPPSGYQYQLGAMHEIGDYARYMSNEYTGVAGDELVQFDEEQWDQVTTRVRTSDPILRGMLRRVAMSNPLMELDGSASFQVRDPEWVRRRFIDPAPEGRTKLVRKVRMDDGSTEEWTAMYLPARLSDNPDPLFRRDYELSLQIRPAHIRQALLRGDWYVTVGGYYSDDFNDSIHTAEPFRIPSTWGRSRSMDWGFKKPGCILWHAHDEEENWVVERELTFQDMLADEVAEECKRIELSMGLWDTRNNCSRITGPADNQLWEERGDVGETKAQSFAKRGIFWTRADKGHKRAGELITAHLRDVRGGVPGLVIFKNCRRTIIDIKTIKRDPKDSDKPLDTGFNHWHDALMYEANFASRGVQPPYEDGRRAGYDDDDNRRKPKSRGATGYGTG